MKNIYDIFDARREEMVESEYQEIQEFYITEEEMFENLLYVSYDSNKLRIIKEEAEESVETSKNGIIKKLTEQMKRVIKWILHMVGIYREKFEAGARFVKKYDLNKCVVKIRNGENDKMIEYHPNKMAFPSIQSKCLNNIHRLINDTRAHSIKLRPEDYDDGDVNQEDEDEKYLNVLLETFRLSDKHKKEIKLSQVNVIAVHNILTELPDANKKLEGLKAKVQNVYNHAINNIRQKGDTDKEKKSNRANNELKMINSNMRKINEQIRGYAKVMTILFNEEYGVAKALVSAATGRKIDDGELDAKEKPENKEGK